MAHYVFRPAKKNPAKNNNANPIAFLQCYDMTHYIIIQQAKQFRLFSQISNGNTFTMQMGFPNLK
jgi:hypothetical protein